MVTLPIFGKNDVYTVNPSKIIALGLNYHAHIQESLSIKVKGLNPEVPKEPILFSKTPNVLVGPEEPIILPAARMYLPGKPTTISMVLPV